jgi:hypothetical protein
MNWELLQHAEKMIGLHDRANVELRGNWAMALRKAVAPRCPVNKVGTPVVSDVDILLATLSERTQALQEVTKLQQKKSKPEPKSP